jgi:hypothetical protein
MKIPVATSTLIWLALVFLLSRVLGKAWLLILATFGLPLSRYNLLLFFVLILHKILIN